MEPDFLLQVLEGLEFSTCACYEVTAGSYEEEVDAGFLFPNVSIPGVPELPEKFDFVVTESLAENIPASEIPFRIFKAGTVRDWIPDYIYPDDPTYWTGQNDEELEIQLSAEVRTLLLIKFLEAQKRASEKFLDQLKDELLKEQAKYGELLLNRKDLELIQFQVGSTYMWINECRIKIIDRNLNSITVEVNNPLHKYNNIQTLPIKVERKLVFKKKARCFVEEVEGVKACVNTHIFLDASLDWHQDKEDNNEG